MSKDITITVPDIGDFKQVHVIEVLVAPGDRVEQEGSLITVESDKASIEIPSPHSGVVRQLLVAVGESVSQGDPILNLDMEEGPESKAASDPQVDVVTPQVDTKPSVVPGTVDYRAEVVVLGAGPGGYTAAFRAADLGKSVILIEREDTLGGVCLNVGCIPSKALLHVAQLINEADQFAKHGVSFGPPSLDLPKLVGWKAGIVRKLTQGLVQLAKQRKVQIVHGTGHFVSSKQIQVETPEGVKTVEFDQVIIAAGSRPARLSLFPWDDPRIMDSTGALEVKDIAQRLLVVGGGIIGLEMAAVYHALGSRITVVELTDELIPGCDRDLIRPLSKIIGQRYAKVYTGTQVTAVEPQSEGLKVRFEGKVAPSEALFDQILVATGRIPNGHKIGAELANIGVDERGYIAVDSQQRTNVPHIFAIGDIVGQPMLAHKATHEGKVAAEVCAGQKSYFDARAIPSVAYTDPEVAWMGVTETEAKAQGTEYEKGVFPWAASGRSLSLGRNEGLTKLLFDKDKRLIGAGIVGTHAGELIAETVLALEMGADPLDIGLTIHPHPTLSETINFAAEMVEGTITDLYVPKKKA